MLQRTKLETTPLHICLANLGVRRAGSQGPPHLNLSPHNSTPVAILGWLPSPHGLHEQAQKQQGMLVSTWQTSAYWFWSSCVLLGAASTISPWDTLQGGEVSSLPSSSGAAGNVVLFAATWGRSLTARQRELKTSSLWTVAAFPWASLLPPLWLQLQPPLSGPPPPPGLISSSRQSFLGTSAAIAKHPTQAAVFWPSRSWQLCFTSTWGG